MIRPVGRLCLALSLAALLAGGVLPVVAAASAPEPASKERVDYLEKRLDEMKAEQRDLQQLLLREMDRVGGETDKSIAAQDKRVSDLQVILGQQGNLFTVLGIIIALAGLGGSFLGYKVVSNKVKEAEEASKRAQDFATNAENSLSRINHNVDRSEELLARQMANLSGPASTAMEPAPVVLPTSGNVRLKSDFATVARELKTIPEHSYSVADWGVLGFDEFNRGNYAAAAERFEKARHVEGATESQVAWATLWAGNSYYSLTGYPKALEYFEEAINRIGTPDDPALMEIAANARLNKGEGYRQLWRLDEALASYTELIGHFDKEQAPALRGQVANALNNRGVTRLTLAKRDWSKLRSEDRDAVLSDAISDLNAAANHFDDLKIESSYAVALGNQGYAYFLTGEKRQAETSLVAALKMGGEAVYRIKLKDAAVLPIPVLDDEFKALVERLWDEVKSKG